MSSLTHKKCISCYGDMPPLEKKEIQLLLINVGPHWSVTDKGYLHRHYTFQNFKAAMDFVNQVANLAEEEGHHPDLTVGWGYCGVEIWTHKIKGLTESDFILGAKIEALYETLG